MAEEEKDPTQYERQVVNYINNFIRRQKGPINIVVDGIGTFRMISGAIQVDTSIKKKGGVTADPKTDIILYRDKKDLFSQDNIFISHKKAGGPEVFQQYGGITEKAGDEIYNHNEVQDFLKNTAKYVDPKKGLTSPVFRPVKDKTLICRSIFGPEYTTKNKKFGLQHCTLIGQGIPTLIKQRTFNTFKLVFSPMSVSGDLSHFTNRYQPVFAGTFRRKRGFKYNNVQYTGVRVGIYPKALVESRTGLKQL